ncbi:DUF3500 domain-containing protein [Usitatibacter palustris]|uniref:DUF3500 domain-containing protein n=1 Tax=Usitatibacter palustris TaxID=2732487 RepID=A0A6M4HDY6_9PROT|nr:DUF3500 domain-containing protein [Usitatibacter palustris]QJR16187.1 hypothetical protein DSM104440_03016 [Usitatibacter palustris]
MRFAKPATLLALGLAIATIVSAHEPAAPKMRAAAEAFIATVPEAQRAKLVLAFTDAKRDEWHYTPRSRPGLSFADLKEPQRKAVHDLLKSALSEAGHRKVVNIIELELVLRETQFGLSFLRDPEKYSLVFFGKPDARATWGWRFEGHHLSLNFTLKGDAAVATTPSFFGANPAEVRKGAKQGLRVLASEQDEALKLLASLDEAQRRTAIVDDRSYGDIVTGASAKASPLEQRGLLASAMTPAQRAQLQKLIEVYADSFEPGLRAARLARVREGDAGNVRFAWAGTPGKGGPHYYRIQGAKFLIEFDASQDDGNHIHTVWRDFDGDFGRDLLREHHALAQGSSHRH